MIRALILDPRDTVATVLSPVEAGNRVALPDGRTLIAATALPIYHKVAVQAVRRGAPILKYGVRIGTATQDIDEGALVHVHNMRSARAQG